MADLECSRCGNTAPGLDQPPFGGELGQRILAATCAGCWREWLDAQVILINENKLTGANPDHVDYLMKQMKTFLNIQDEGS